MKIGARKSNVRVKLANRSLSTAHAKKLRSVMRKLSKSVTISATKCTSFNKPWRPKIRLQSLPLSMNTSLNRWNNSINCKLATPRIGNNIKKERRSSKREYTSNSNKVIWERSTRDSNPNSKPTRRIVEHQRRRKRSWSSKEMSLVWLLKSLNGTGKHSPMRSRPVKICDHYTFKRKTTYSERFMLM